MKRDFLVYLAGPIAGLTYDQGQDWRQYVASRFPEEIHAVSPLRCKAERLVREGIILDSYEDHPMTSQKGLTTRDRYDCTRADAVLMNLLGAKQVSVGTMIEVGWTDVSRIPLIVVMEKTGNLHDHPMVRECAGFRVETLDEGIKLCETILLPSGESARPRVRHDLPSPYDLGATLRRSPMPGYPGA